ncbi:FecR domain-containing protein [uncultured Draconibacterium sp.]|uniref:FecR family protein n=1 Tax=uncultured Draconibacterium sp. TaxID=1573823 RepID=UPI0025FC8123|nr:FecR domain-containing protein [uncultured Draconibacterium sp.]
MTSPKSFLEKESIPEQLLEIVKEVENVNVDKAFYKVENSIKKKKQIFNLYRSVSRYAAFLALPLAIALVWSLNINQSTDSLNNITYNEVQCPIGVRSKLVLPDGSRVALNSGSSVKYQIPFEEKNRKIFLEGEAFFDIKNNEKSNFIVETQNIRIDVLGTKFNVKSYPEEESIKVSLEEGSINLSRFSEQNESDKMELKPGQLYKFNKKTGMGKIELSVVENLSAWRNNILEFDETPIGELAQILERWYGVDIEIESKEIEKYKFTTTFEGQSLSQILELLEMSSPIKVEYITGQTSSANNQYLKSKVIIRQN